MIFHLSLSECVTIAASPLINAYAHTHTHTVCDDHYFKDDKLFYRFRKDDGTYQEPADAAILARGQRIYGR